MWDGALSFMVNLSVCNTIYYHHHHRLNFNGRIPSETGLNGFPLVIFIHLLMVGIKCRQHH